MARTARATPPRARSRARSGRIRRETARDMARMNQAVPRGPVAERAEAAPARYGAARLDPGGAPRAVCIWRRDRHRRGMAHDATRFTRAAPLRARHRALCGYTWSGTAIGVARVTGAALPGSDSVRAAAVPGVRRGLTCLALPGRRPGAECDDAVRHESASGIARVIRAASPWIGCRARCGVSSMERRAAWLASPRRHP